MNIIVVGLPKSGTTTIDKALRNSGYITYHQRGKTKFLADEIYDNLKLHNDIFYSFESENVALTQLDYIHEGTGIWPQINYKFLRKISNLENTKFILNYRNPQKIISSFENYRNGKQRLFEANVPHMPVLKNNEDFYKFILSHFKKVRRIFKDKNFIEIDIEDPNSKIKLEKFLNTKLTWWGVANRTTKRKRKQ